jgi:FkbM family methyltransferase
MSLRDGFHTYYGLFGFRGLLAVARARIGRTVQQIAISVPHIAHPIYVRLRTSDISTFSQVIVQQEYACALCEVPSTIIDAGANIGLTSVFYANKYPSATIIAIEPECSNFEMLLRNVAPYPNIIAVRAALWSDEKQLEVIDPGLGKYGFQIHSPRDTISDRSGNHVMGITVRGLMREYGLQFIDVLKVDIEGSEKEVFDDASGWIDSIGVIVIELHDHLRPGCSQVLYKTTRDFSDTRRTGETVFLARRNYLDDADSGVPNSLKAERARFLFTYAN